jgi:hypothetical protein
MLMMDDAILCSSEYIMRNENLNPHESLQEKDFVHIMNVNDTQK